MKRSSIPFKVGTRASKLALLQAGRAVERLRGILPGRGFELVARDTPGDRDRKTDLRESPADFFTRDLDRALLAGELDCALHSAKDLPYPVAPGLDWVWLPWREDRRDALVLAPGRSVSEIPARAVAGVSSERRCHYCRERFPDAELRPIRGNIEARLAQLDRGDFDLLIMAAAALVRLGLSDRISEWIPLSELPSPPGQGTLALTFRAGDERFLRLRSLFVRSVAFVGAGAGRGGCTVGGLAALGRAEVCLYDALLDQGLLATLPPECERINVGKRCGTHRRTQTEICGMLTDLARQGRRVVRLKGGDPGIYGRLAEEAEALDRLRLPYRVLPGLSALTVATSTTGMLLTRRGVSRGFTVMTPRAAGGALATVGAEARAELPLVLFMAVSVIGRVAEELLAEGTAPATPAAVVFGAGTGAQRIVRSTLDAIGGALSDDAGRGGAGQPGLVVIGEVARYAFPQDHGALGGRRVLVTCSEALQAETAALVEDFGGVPVSLPLIRLTVADAAAAVGDLAGFDWVAVTSPSAVRCLLEAVRQSRQDVRAIPKLLVCGEGTARALERFGLKPAAMPTAAFGSEATVAAAGAAVKPGETVLRLRSEKAGPELADGLGDLGCPVTDRVLYGNQQIRHRRLPEVDAVLFASASAVESYLDQWPAATLNGKTVVAIGKPTLRQLADRGIEPVAVADEATVAGLVSGLAQTLIRRTL